MNGTNTFFFRNSPQSCVVSAQDKKWLLSDLATLLAKQHDKTFWKKQTHYYLFSSDET